MAIGDPKEVWYIEAGSGHHWVAVRVPDDSYMIAANHLRIDKVDLADTNNYAGSEDLIAFAEDNGLYDPETDGEFNFTKAFGTTVIGDTKNLPRLWWGEKMLTPSANLQPNQDSYPLFMKPDNKIALKDVMSVFRSHYDGSEYDTYNTVLNSKFRPINVNTCMESHILQLRSWLPNEIGGVHWLAMGVPDTSVYVPFYSGITDTPQAYKLGTDTYDKESAYWSFRSVSAMTNVDFAKFSLLVLPEWQKLEAEEFEKLADTDKEALKLYNKTSPTIVSVYLTKTSEAYAQKALEKANELESTLMVKLTKLKASY